MSMASLLFPKRFLLPVSRSPSITLQCRANCKTSVTNEMVELKPVDSIPSPKGAVPFLGHSLLIMRKMQKQNFSEILDQFFKELGPLIRLKFPGGFSPVMSCDPAVAETLFRNEGYYPSRLTILEKNMQWLYNKRQENTTLPFESGEKWKQLRSLHGKQHAPANVYGYIPGFNRAADRFLQNIVKAQDENGYVDDVKNLITYWSFEVGAYFTVGAEIDAITDHNCNAIELKECTERGIKILDRIIKAVPLYKLMPTKLRKDFNRCTDKMNEIGRKYADLCMEKINGNVQKAEGKKRIGQSLMEQWLIEGRMPIETAIQSSTILLATGMDTTAATVAFVLYELSKHREVQEKLRDQVVSVLGETGEADGLSLQKMPYLMSVIKEAQRLNPVVTIFSRTLDTDIELNGYNIPAQTPINVCQYAIGRDKKIYKDPHKFDPDRWSRDNIHPYSLLQFGVGIRSCWGRRFAEVEMKTLLTKLCRCFIMECDDPPEKRLPFKEETILRPIVPIKIKFTERQ